MDEPDPEDSDDSDDSDEDSTYTTKQIIAVFDAYDGISKDANAHRVVAVLLQNCGRHTSALTYARRALKLSTEPALRFRILNLVANIHLSKKNGKAASEAIDEGLSYRHALTPKLLRIGLISRARIEAASGMKAQAINSFEEARLANPEEPLQGFNLKDAFKTSLELKDDAMLIDMVKKWNPMELLAFMTWNFPDSGHDDYEEFRRAANRAGQQEYMY